MGPKTAFEVYGRTAVITGGSSGMGLSAACQLAAKGANVVLVARDVEKLASALAAVEAAAPNRSQQFRYISADLTSYDEAVRVIDEVVSWNAGSPPDIVWACAGSSHPSLFIDTPASTFSSQMNTNYFTGLNIAHAVLRRWLLSPAVSQDAISIEAMDKSKTPTTSASATRHIIFTGSFLSFYSFAGYTPYSPCKAALRSLVDTLSMEMQLYGAAHPNEPKVRAHGCFPAGILTEGFEAENRIKTDLTKHLEEGDDPQLPDAIASKCIRGLESGQEIITTDFLTSLVRRSMLGGSIRGGFLNGLLDWFLSGWLAIIMVFVRGDMDKKVQKWGLEHGASGMKRK